MRRVDETNVYQQVALALAAEGLKGVAETVEKLVGDEGWNLAEVALALRIRRDTLEALLRDRGRLGLQHLR